MPSDPVGRISIRLLWGIPSVFALLSVRWPGLLHVFFGGLLALWLGGIVVAVGSGLAERYGAKAAPIWIHGVFAGVVIVSIAATRWPLHLAVVASGPMLNRMMVDAEAGRLTDRSAFAGFMPNLGTTRIHGRWPAIILHDDPAGGTYLVRNDGSFAGGYESFPVAGGWRLFHED